MKYRLKKDIVIPKGTIFDTETMPKHTAYGVCGWCENLIGLTKDTCGHFRYPIDFEEDENLKEWFESCD